MERVCVFCGSRLGARDVYGEAARRLGAALGRRGLGLVYGGGDCGLMGVVAQAALNAGAEVIGIIPQALMEREVTLQAIGEMRVVGSMHERKARMADLADGFVTLPGGFGTLDETFEILTWAQVGFHGKPVGLLNVAGFYDPLLAFVAHAVDEGLLRPEHARLPLVETDPERLLARMESVAVAPVISKWDEVR